MKREDYQRQGYTIQFNPSCDHVGLFAEYDLRQQEELTSAQQEHNFTITTGGIQNQYRWPCEYLSLGLFRSQLVVFHVSPMYTASYLCICARYEEDVFQYCFVV